MQINSLIYKIKSLLASIKLSKPCIDDNSLTIRSVCIVLINVGLGDAIMATSFIRFLKESGVDVDIIVGKKTIPLFSSNDDIGNVIAFGDKSAYQRKTYDLVIDPYSHCSWYATNKYLKLFYLLRYKILSGFDVNLDNKYHDNYIPDDKHIHITDYYRYVGRKFISDSCVLPSNYILPFPDVVQSVALNYMASLPDNTFKVAICPFASTPKRSFSDVQLNEILSLFSARKDLSVVLLMEKSKLSSISLCDNSYFFEAPDFMSAAAVLCQCDFVASVDTSFVHVANSGNKPALVFYSSVYNDGYNTDNLCGPNYQKAKQIIEKDGISNIPPKLIYDEVIFLFNNLVND